MVVPNTFVISSVFVTTHGARKRTTNQRSGSVAGRCQSSRARKVRAASVSYRRDGHWPRGRVLRRLGVHEHHGSLRTQARNQPRLGSVGGRCQISRSRKVRAVSVSYRRDGHWPRGRVLRRLGVHGSLRAQARSRARNQARARIRAPIPAR